MSGMEEMPLQKELSWIDYYSFGGMLGISVLIGIYFGFFGTKQNTKNEYLMGGRTMQVVPIAISLIASHTSGGALLSAPADVYKYGFNYIWLCNAIILSGVACCYVFMPVFHKLQLTSTYEYLNIRFDRRVRSLASFIYILYVLFQCPITVYVPALAFSQGSGANIHVVALIICSICIFYTTVGGVKAVVWTDTVQTVVMLASMVLVLVLGLTSAGGFWNIIDTAHKGQHLNLNFNIDPTIRDSFWTFTIGGTIQWFNVFAVNQVTIQRLLAVPSISNARMAVFLTILGIVAVKLTSLFTGLIIFSKYSNCDPLQSKQIKRIDELLPFYVVDVAGHIPGLSGLFISGILGAGLSTLSGSLNTVAATIFEDFMLPFLPKNITEKRVSIILKLIVIVFGIIITALVFVVENLGGILPLSVSFNAMTGGALLGMFALGMLFPTSNAKGALFGGICGLLFSLFVVLGNLWYKSQPYYVDPVLPLSVNGCIYPVNIHLKKPDVSSEDVFYLFRVSFWYYSLIGSTTTIMIGLLVSSLTKTSEIVDISLLSSLVHRFCKKQEVNEQANKNFLSVDKTLQLVDTNEQT